MKASPRNAGRPGPEKAPFGNATELRAKQRAERAERRAVPDHGWLLSHRGCAGDLEPAWEAPKSVEAPPDDVRSQGSTTYSTTSTPGAAEEEATPRRVDIHRLERLKKQQEIQLLAVRARTEQLKAQEHEVWKKMTRTQEAMLQGQEVQWRRQAERLERVQTQREAASEGQALRGRAREMRSRAVETREMQKLSRFRENQLVGEKMRQDSRQLIQRLWTVQEQTAQTKAMSVEVRKQQKRKLQLQRNLEAALRGQTHHDHLAAKYAELRADIQAVDQAIESAETEELGAVQKLQNSKLIQSELLAQLGGSDAGSTPKSMASFSPPSRDLTQPHERDSAGGLTESLSLIEEEDSLQPPTL